MLTLHPITARSIKNALFEANYLFENEYSYWRIPCLTSIVDLINLKTIQIENKIIGRNSKTVSMRALEIINHSLWGLVQLDIEINPDKFLPFDEGRFHYKNALNDFYKFANQQNDCRLDMIERLVIEKYASIMIKKAEELGNIFKRHRNKKVIIKSTFYDLILWSSIGHANHKAT